MRHIHAFSIAPAVTGWLEDSRHPRILHVFDRACNLINERKEILSIVAPEIGNGPFNLVIKAGFSFTEHLSLRSPVTASPNCLTLGALTIHTQHATLWPPRPDWERLHAYRDDILCQLVSSRAARFATKRPPRAGADCFGRTNATLSMTEITKYQLPTTQIANSLFSSLAIADLPACLSAARKLAGLGIGLTPSGDDIILGAIFAVRILHPHGIADGLTREVADTAAALTTSLSAAWLRSGGKGEAGVLWHDLFDALISGESPRIRSKIIQLLSVGYSSGADALSGFFGLISVYASLGHWKFERTAS